MSTKVIREVLEMFRREASFPESPRARKAAEALAEVEAIEKAARTVDTYFEVPLSMNVDETCIKARLLMRDIANESEGRGA